MSVGDKDNSNNIAEEKNVQTFSNSPKNEVHNYVDNIKDFTNMKQVPKIIVYFNYDSSGLKKGSGKLLSAFISRVKNNFQIIKVEGHTCSLGSNSYNSLLSKNRAIAVKNILISEGIPLSDITTYAYGEEKPRFSNDTIEGRQKNRRVEMYLSKH